MFHRLRERLSALIDPTPDTTPSGKDNSPITLTSEEGDYITIIKRLRAFDEEICSVRERAAAVALLDSGMEDRPLHAIERAHAVMEAIDLFDSNTKDGDRFTVGANLVLRAPDGQEMWLSLARRYPIPLHPRPGDSGPGSVPLAVLQENLDTGEMEVTNTLLLAPTIGDDLMAMLLPPR